MAAAIREIISDLPDTAKRRTREGFAVAAALTPEARQRTLAHVEEAIQSGGMIDSRSLGEALKLTPKDVGALVTSVTALVGLLSDGDVSEQDFLDQARGALFNETDEATVAILVKSCMFTINRGGHHGAG